MTGLVLVGAGFGIGLAVGLRHSQQSPISITDHSDPHFVISQSGTYSISYRITPPSNAADCYASIILLQGVINLGPGEHGIPNGVKNVNAMSRNPDSNSQLTGTATFYLQADNWTDDTSSEAVDAKGLPINDGNQPCVWSYMITPK